MEETKQLSASEELQQIEARRLELREKVLKEKEEKQKKDAEMRAKRDNKLEEVTIVLKKIQSAIHIYNKLGKVAKDQYDIFGIINETMFPDETIENSDN